MIGGENNKVRRLSQVFRSSVFRLQNGLYKATTPVDIATAKRSLRYFNPGEADFFVLMLQLIDSLCIKCSTKDTMTQISDEYFSNSILIHPLFCFLFNCDNVEILDIDGVMTHCRTLYDL